MTRANIKTRFYEALHTLVASGEMKSVRSYCMRYGFVRSQFHDAEHKPYNLQVDWLAPLVVHYGVSAKWLFSGVGEMFEKRTKSAQNEQKCSKNAQKMNKSAK